MTPKPKPKPDALRFIRRDEVADLLGVSTRTVQRFVDDEGLPCYRISHRHVLFDAAEVARWIADRRVAR